MHRSESSRRARRVAGRGLHFREGREDARVKGSWHRRLALREPRHHRRPPKPARPEQSPSSCASRPCTAREWITWMPWTPASFRRFPEHCSLKAHLPVPRGATQVPCRTDRALGLPANTCLCLPSLHPLREWSLRQTRGSIAHSAEPPGLRPNSAGVRWPSALCGRLLR